MRTALVITIGLGLAVSTAAEAKPRVALVTFEGDPGGEAQDVVTEAIGDDVMLVGPKQVNRTVDKLGLDTSDLAEKDLRKLSKELQADAVIQGKLTKKGDNKLLHFKLFVRGKKQKGFKVEFGSLKSKKFRAQLHDKMIERLDADGSGDMVASKKKTSGDDDEDPIAGKKKKAGKGDDSDALKTMKKKSGDDDEVKPSHKTADADEAAPKKHGDEDAADEEKPHKKKKVAHADEDGETAGADVEAHATLADAGSARGANRDGFRFDLGGSFHNRSLKFTSRSFPQAPKPFTQKTVPGARFGAEVYPLVFGNPYGIASGLGLGGMYDQTIGLKLTSSVQPGTQFPVTERRYSIGPKFRVLFGRSETAPAITIGVGYMRHTYTVNRGGLATGNSIDLPDVDYAGFNPSLEFRIPVVKQLAFVVGGEGILLTSAGPIQNLDSYGQATVTGASGSVGVDVVVMKHVGFALRGEATQIGYKFTGNGALANNRDMMPASKDIGGAADRYIGGSATIAILY